VCRDGFTNQGLGHQSDPLAVSGASQHDPSRLRSRCAYVRDLLEAVQSGGSRGQAGDRRRPHQVAIDGIEHDRSAFLREYPTLFTPAMRRCFKKVKPVHDIDGYSVVCGEQIRADLCVRAGERALSVHRDRRERFLPSFTSYLLCLLTGVSVSLNTCSCLTPGHIRLRLRHLVSLTHPGAASWRFFASANANSFCLCGIQSLVMIHRFTSPEGLFYQ